MQKLDMKLVEFYQYFIEQEIIGVHFLTPISD